MVSNGIHILAAVLGLLAAVVSMPVQAQQLDLAQARAMVLEHHEGLKALRKNQAAAEEALRQASAYLNPEIEVEAEDFGRAEIEMVLTQPILLGGRRRAAVAMAQRQAEIASLELAAQQVSVEAELVRRFIPVLSARRKLDLVDSLLAVSSGGIDAVGRLVEAGAAMEIDVLRAELDRDELALERARLERHLSEAQMRLCALWGEEIFRFSGVQGSLALRLDLPYLEELKAAVARHAEFRLLEADRRLIESEIDEARAEAWPELALSAGYLRNNEIEEEAAIVGLSLSLPVLNRNGAAVAGKRHELAAAAHEAKLGHVERTAELAVLYSQIQGAAGQLAEISGGVLSKAGRIHRALEDFYVHGKVGILDVLEARRHLLELEMRIVDLTEKQALLAADLHELSGYPIEIIR
jgi:cobalt-zinc-cadmium efflux system outer membrane protein